jgi:transcriptional regulator with XRE-family HTH domain
VRRIVREQKTGAVSIGAKVRELRRERGLSLRTLAGRTGFSPSFISQMEAEAVSPSIASLEKVAEELGVSLGQFFSSLESAPREVVRREERPEYESGWSKSTISLLVDAVPGRKLSAAEIKVEPGGSSGKRSAFGAQEAVVLVLSGELLVGLEGREVELFEGDSVYVSEGTEFSWENAGSEEATLLMVATPGRSDFVSALLGERETR